MKVLLLTSDCSPAWGGEGKVGWKWATILPKYVDKVKVVTFLRNKKAIESFLSENPIDNLSFEYIEQKRSNNRVINKFLNSDSIDLQLYQIKLFKKVKDILEKEKYDVIHQVTPVELRAIGYSWKFAIPFVYGPVGGGQSIPDGLSFYYRNNKMKENFRKLANKIICYSPYYGKAIKNINRYYVANPETEKFLKHKWKGPFFLTSDIGTEGKIYPKIYKSEEKIKILWVGRLIHLKGLELFFDAIARIKNRKDFEVLIVGNDSYNEKMNYESYAQKLGISEKISFLGNISYENMRHIYQSSDIFCFTSLRETGGSVLLEAAECGLPIIMPNQNLSFALENTALTFNVKSGRSEAIKTLSNSIIKLLESEEMRRQMSNSSYSFAQNFTWEKKIKKIADEYNKIENFS